jgi:hypothetical protein
MLYSKREQKLGPEDFKNPGSEYRATPFWAWNNKLDKNELVWQIEQFKKMGFGGFHMHSRPGLATEYLGDEFMEAVRASVEKAREEKMLAWLYDEDRYPSGYAGGIVTKDPKYRIQHLLLTRHPYGGAPSQISFEKRNLGDPVCRYENGELVACFDVVLDKNGDLESYKTIGEKDGAHGLKLYAYLETSHSIPWFSNQAYANTLDPATIKEFIRVTYDAYEKRFGKDFGGLIPAIFTDEPQFTIKGTLNFAREDKDITLPWTFDLEDTYRKAYNGESLRAGIPELIWDLKGGKISTVRYHYHDHVTERFVQAFADQLGSWCEKHGIMFTGHMLNEPTLESQTIAVGEAMRSYRSFQLPGIDMLRDWHEYTTAKQAQSSARQMGVPGVLSELYSSNNWNWDFRGHKHMGDWQAALGVTVRVPHVSWVSMKGEAKRDAPAPINYQSPWYKEYSYVENHFARVAAVMTRGSPVCRIGVIHPIESYWLHWGVRENTANIRKEMDRNFQNLCNWLLRGLIDFDYICESTLPQYCDTADIKKDSFPVGNMKYSVIIVPAMETMRRTTLERLEAFKKTGGRLIFLGAAPKYVDAIPDDRGVKLFESCEKIGFERLPVLTALEDIREVDIRDGSGARTEDLFYQIREEADAKWLFIAHADRPQIPDLPKGDIIRINIKGEWAVQLYDTITGNISPIPIHWRDGWTFITRPWYEYDTLLIKLDKSEPLKDSGEVPRVLTNALEISFDGATPPDVVPLCIRFLNPVPVTLEEPNVLLLDMPEYALDDGEWRPREEILRLDNTLRSELGWPVRNFGSAQPWVEYDTSTPHTLKLRYTFESEIPVTGAELALENAAITQIILNGEKADGTIKGWYVDKAIKKISLPAIKAGTNVLEASFPYGRKIDAEAMYILGDFGVKTAGMICTIIKPVRSLVFGDITTQGLPFYGGNLTYHLEAESKGDKLTIEVSNYRTPLLKVKVDGKDYGPLVYPPYIMEIPGLEKGEHKIDLVCFGSRINTFGQLHTVYKEMGFRWGANSWRTFGVNWSYEYQFWPQGVLKSPEIE